MAPAVSRETRAHHSQPSKRRRSVGGHEQGSDGTKRPRIENDSIQPQATPSAPYDPPTIPSSDGRTAATAPDDGNLGHAGQGSQQWTETGQYRPPNVPTLTVVERATVLCMPSPFSYQRQLSVLDISFGSTCQINFCAQIEGFNSMWVGKLSCMDLRGELFRHVLGDDDTRKLCYIFVGEGKSTKVMGRHLGGTGFTGNHGNAVHCIIWPQPYSVNTPSRDIVLGEEAGFREFVELIGGCWIE